MDATFARQDALQTLCSTVPQQQHTVLQEVEEDFIDQQEEKKETVLAIQERQGYNAGSSGLWL
jgi:hypothetical protein